MSQNDFVIANQTAPNFRSDLNNALVALATQSSGATEPTTTYANMIWYDTTTSTLKMRTEADDGWIDLGTLDQVAGTFSVAGLVLATQAAAEAGTNNDQLMTPLRTAQAITEVLSVRGQGAIQYIGEAVIDTDAFVVFTDLDDDRFSGHLFVLENIIPDENNRSLACQLSIDNGVTFFTGSGQYVYTLNGGSQVLESSIRLAQNVGGDTNENGYSGKVELFQNRNAKHNFVLSFGTFTNSSAAIATNTSGGRTGSTALVNAVRFFFEISGSVNGNLLSGTIRHYGIRNSAND